MAPNVSFHHFASMAHKEDRDDAFGWTDAEVELLLEAVKVFANQCQFEGKDWESIKSKYERIKEIFTERYPKDAGTVDCDYPKSSALSTFTKERIASKLKYIKRKYRRAVDSGRKSGGGKSVMSFFHLCKDIWAGSPSTNSIEGL